MLPIQNRVVQIRDRLILARHLLLIAVIFTGICCAVAALAFSIPERSATRQSKALMRILNLSAPSLIPSGRPLRHPDAALPGIDWRFTPLLPSLAPDVQVPPFPKPEA